MSTVHTKKTAEKNSAYNTEVTMRTTEHLFV